MCIIGIVILVICIISFILNGKEKHKIIDCHYEQNGVRYKNMYDENWQTLDYVYSFKSAGKKIEKPKNFDEIIKICDKLNEDTNYVRVDLYCVDDKIYFCELTFIPAVGYAKFQPKSANLLWGEYMGDEIVKSND